MHARLEIIMPPTDDVEAAVELILKPFSENEEDCSDAFWDWWVIGGRWSGRKLTDALDKEKLEQFNEAMKDMGVTVSGVVAGKQELKPEAQIPAVDGLWRDIFPDSPFKSCPMFRHSNDQYDSKDNLPGDVVLSKDLSEEATCSRLIVAGHGHEDKLEAAYMLADSIWNGVNYEDTAWDGIIKSGVSSYEKDIERYAKEWKEKHTIKDDWLVVTVDYHS